MARPVPRALRSFVAGSDDRRLERLIGSRPGLRLVFAGLARAYVPGSLDGFVGEVGFALRRGGRTIDWTLAVARGAAVARPGAAEGPAVLLRLGVADMVRIGVGELDPMRALLAGRLDVEGDFAVATRLGELFGRGGGGGGAAGHRRGGRSTPT